MSNELTFRLLQRIRELTNPKRNSENAENDLREYYFALHESRSNQIGDFEQEINTLKNDLSRLRQEFGINSIISDEQYFRRLEIPSGLLELIQSIQIRLDKLTDIVNIKRQIDNLDYRLDSMRQIDISPIERTLADEYFSMSQNDFDSLTPEMNLFFLESMLQLADIPENNLERLVDVYLQNPHSILRYVTMNIFIKINTNSVFLTKQLIDRIYNIENSEQRRMLIDEIVSALINIGNNILIFEENHNNQQANVQNTNNAFKMLDDLVSLEKQIQRDGFQVSISTYIESNSN